MREAEAGMDSMLFLKVRMPTCLEKHLFKQTWAVPAGSHPPLRPPEPGFTKQAFSFSLSCLFSVYKTYTRSSRKVWEVKQITNKRILQISTTQRLAPRTFQQISFHSFVFVCSFCPCKWNNIGFIPCCGLLSYFVLYHGLSPPSPTQDTALLVSHAFRGAGQGSIGGGVLSQPTPRGKATHLP